MKVAHNNNSSTAVVGNLEVIKMGIDNSPAFFHILSSSLYQHPIMAFIREVISNAEDARRCSDNPSHPIEIAITEEEFCVKDMGTGIPHDLIKEVYGTYGKGTKANDSNSIGGLTC